MTTDHRLKPLSRTDMAEVCARRAQAMALKSRYAYLSRFNALIFILVMVALIALILRIIALNSVLAAPDWAYHALLGAASLLAASMAVGFYLNFNFRRQSARSRDMTFYSRLPDEALWKRLEQQPRTLAVYRSLLALQAGIYQYQIDALRIELMQEENSNLHERYHFKPN